MQGHGLAYSLGWRGLFQHPVRDHYVYSLLLDEDKNTHAIDDVL